MTSVALAQALATALAERGTSVAFGVPGGGSNLDVIGAFAAAGISFVLVHTETAAAVMASVTGELSGVPGVCVATRGPGAASTVNGMAQALLDRSPVVLVTDCVPADQRARVSHQRLDQTSLLATVTKGSFRYSSAEQAKAAVALALDGRPGPVHLDLDPTGVDVEPIRVESAMPTSDDELASVYERVRSAQRPLMIAGVGALALADDRRVRLERALGELGAPVMTTYKAKGAIPDSSPWAAGVVTGATIEAPLLDRADLVVGVGLDPVELIPAPWPYTAPTVLMGGWPVDDSTYFGERLVGEVVGHLDELVAGLGRLPTRWPGATVGHERASARARLRPVDDATARGLSPQHVVTAARAIAPAGTIATIDAGAHMLGAVPLWDVEHLGELLISNGLATMGFALPAAVGAALARPSTRVVCFTGDGGIAMALAELETLARLALDVVVVVFNDAALSLIEIKQKAEGHGGPGAVRYRRTDFAAIARGCGVASERVSDPRSYEAALRAALARPGPSLLDVRVDPGGYRALLDAIRGGRPS